MLGKAVMENPEEDRNSFGLDSILLYEGQRNAAEWQMGPLSSAVLEAAGCDAGQQDPIELPAASSSKDGSVSGLADAAALRFPSDIFGHPSGELLGDADAFMPPPDGLFFEAAPNEFHVPQAAQLQPLDGGLPPQEGRLAKLSHSGEDSHKRSRISSLFVSVM